MQPNTKEKFVDPVDLVVDNAAEDVCQPSLRIDGVELGGFSCCDSRSGVLEQTEIDLPQGVVFLNYETGVVTVGTKDTIHYDSNAA